MLHGHSFRIGAATTAVVVGIADSSIQTLGRWQSAAFLIPHDYVSLINPTVTLLWGYIIIYTDFQSLYSLGLNEGTQHNYGHAQLSLQT